MNYLSRRLLCNALTQLHVDYGCISWYLLGASARGYTNPSHFRKINWLPAERRVELCTSTTVFKYWKRIVPPYLNDMFMPSLNNYNTRFQMALDIPLCRTIRPGIRLSSNIKTAATTASFTHRLKKNSQSEFKSFLDHPCHLRSKGIFSFSRASLLFNYFTM